MEKVKLQKHKAFDWHRSGRINARGYLFDRNGNFFQNDSLGTYFSGVENFTDFQERVQYANGLFSVLYEDDSSIYAACDPFRTFPVYYTRKQENWEISDDPFLLCASSGLHMVDQDSFTEFLATGFVTGEASLIEGVRQLQAGEIIHFKKEELHKFFYHSFRNNIYREDDYKDLKAEGIHCIEEAFKRFIESLQGRTVVVPLSGGYDSRLIAVMLKKLAYPNVICITYGRKGNEESSVSCKVAEKLGFDWKVVEYTPSLIEGFTETDDFRKFSAYSGGLSSMFYLQEYFAVKYLRDNKLIPVDSIFAPGLLGDFLAGNLLNKTGNLNMEETIEQTAQRIYHYKYIYRKPGHEKGEMLMRRIERRLVAGFRRRSDFAYSLQEDWELKERYAKFIINSASTYTFFGYDFRLPFADKELVEFFRRLPLHAKVNKYLYDDILTGTMFEPYDLNFPEELQPGTEEIRKNMVKQQVKQYLPEFIKRPFTRKSDKLFYREITEMLKSNLAANGIRIRVYGNSYNSLIIQWYAEQIKQNPGNKP